MSLRHTPVDILPIKVGRYVVIQQVGAILWAKSNSMFYRARSI